MSEVKHSFRVMVIDIAEDKVVVDEFCDAIVAGLASNGGKIREYNSSEIVACKCNFIAGIGAVEAAERAVMKQKKEFVKSFMKKASPEDIAKALKLEDEE